MSLAVLIGSVGLALGAVGLGLLLAEFASWVIERDRRWSP